MNTQREVIYKKRRHALHGERMEVEIAGIFDEITEAVVNGYHEDKDYKGFELELFRTLSIKAPMSEEQFSSMAPEKVADQVYDTASKLYGRKSVALAEATWPVVKDVYENQSDQYRNIVVPFTDGKRTLNVVANLQNAYESQGRELIREVEKGVTLAIIDNAWKEHLRDMDDLRQSVQNARFEQKDPLLIYKFESFELFKTMMLRVNDEIGGFLIKANLPSNMSQGAKVRTTDSTRRGEDNLGKAQASKTEVPEYGKGSSGAQAPDRAPAPQRPKVTQPIRTEKKIGRNEKCPCGSGKKYKQCHGKAQPTA